MKPALFYPPRAFPSGRDSSGRTVVRFHAVLAGPGGPPAGFSLRRRLMVVPYGKGVSLKGMLVGLSAGKRPAPLIGEIALPPGRFRAFLPDFPGLVRRFDIPHAPGAPVRIYCHHAGKTPSRADTLASFGPDGRARVSAWTYAVNACCWKGTLVNPFPPAGRALCWLQAVSRPLRLATDAGALHLRPGEAAVAKMRGPIRMDAEGTPPPHYRQITIAPDILDDFLRASGLAGIIPGNGFLCRPAPATPALLAAVADLERALGHDDLPGADFQTRLAIDRFLLAVVRELPTRLKAAWRQHPSPRFPDPRLEKAVRHLEQNLARTYDRSALARAAGASRQLLAVLFRRHLHQTPVQYLQGIRIAKAQALLAGHGMGISKVAAAVGYKDFRTFKRLFRKLSERPLSAYRRA